ncbi:MULTISPECIES: hypothetical protein [Leuconostoc]|uniref:Uncharacterized protein n=1 Tax=Leuconostoc inhae TaxID=178001 RepID=A0AAN2QUK8_9LACO|nr:MULTISPECIES: hypothetical protein [Leuconostoc]MBZ5947841.1 hypothetical protein [Leuconostoc gasicomitatum]MBZ5955671.1 hypothetical protein [Leuconostoc gasicomitatum]MBZ5960711.1 hypothetical protein [Leuconostoc gasicomitatum]MBZ5979785.1 hypothetical protein [Leuconostoc gasicomitatum]MBZ5983416.1 hypothetical protein [Leuconostoc gasicomitatum]
MGKFSRFSNETMTDTEPTVLKHVVPPVIKDTKFKSIKIKEKNYKQLALLKAITGTSYIELFDLAVSRLVDEPEYSDTLKLMQNMKEK